ncbi:uncharacterized protein LOC131659084 [Vicia villosa]|uniref:uncharacterized protein LOC131659084 n=1 Tax=Vicia villosa TaxID=3911 RepID=UPI00273B6981|nr:uncharacterized protein LOC131659084 [Vicia villosa]
MLYTAAPVFDEKYVFTWRLNNSGVFSVNSVSALLADYKDVAWPVNTMESLNALWKVPTPLRYKIFGWRIHPESLNHLCFSCNVSKVIWCRVLLWLGEIPSLTIDGFLDFGFIQEKVVNVKARMKINSIWIATTWSLWYMRNAMIFEKEEYSFDMVYYKIMYLSWCWLASCNPGYLSSFYDWYKSPMDCF